MEYQQKQEILPGNTEAQIGSILNQFDVLIFDFDKRMGKYLPIYLICSLILGELLMAPFVISQSHFKVGFSSLIVNALPMIAIILVIKPFNKWQSSIKKMLADLWETKRIYPFNNDLGASYLSFLRDYHKDLSSSQKYVFIAILLIVFTILIIYTIVRASLFSHQNVLVTTLYIMGSLLAAFSYLGGLYCVVTGGYAIYISGKHIRKLAQTFEFKIQPFHTDRCGGLKALGNVCVSLVSLLLVCSGLIIGYIFVFFITDFINTNLIKSDFDTTSRNIIIIIILYIGIPCVVLLYIFLAIIRDFILPLHDIHKKMLSQRETYETIYNTCMDGLLEPIQGLLDNYMVEEVKKLQEKKAVLEAFYTPYPTWPLRFPLKIFPSFLGSLLTGMISAAVPVFVPHVFPRL